MFCKCGSPFSMLNKMNWPCSSARSSKLLAGGAYRRDVIITQLRVDITLSGLGIWSGRLTLGAIQI